MHKFAIAIMFGLAVSIVVSDANADYFNEDDMKAAGFYVCFDDDDRDDWRATMMIPHEDNDTSLTALQFDDVLYPAWYFRAGIAQRWVILEEDSLEDENDEIPTTDYQFVIDGNKQNGRYWLGYYDFSMVDEDGNASARQVFYCDHMTEGEYFKETRYQTSNTEAAADSGARAVYMALIRQKIERNWAAPASATSELECSVRVRQIPGGEVIGVTILSCNGDDAVRRSVEAAVHRSSPLPEPSDPSLFDRNILLSLSIRQ